MPIIYRPEYNIRVPGAARLHDFDVSKNRRVFNELSRNKFFGGEGYIMPGPLAADDLFRTHAKSHLAGLKNPDYLARIFQIPLLSKVPAFLTRHAVLNPLSWQAAGTVCAVQEAVKHGVAVNLGGGFHHARRDFAHGFCPYADITLAVNKIREENKKINKIMILDLDAHQGDGHERDFMNDPDVFIVDFFTANVFPSDLKAMKRINVACPLEPCTKDDQYLGSLEQAFRTVSYAFAPDLILYVAGTDILEGDPKGLQAVSAAGVIERDAMVAQYAMERGIPLAVTFGGGYQKSNAPVIARSVINMARTFG